MTSSANDDVRDAPVNDISCSEETAGAAEHNELGSHCSKNKQESITKKGEKSSVEDYNDDGDDEEEEDSDIDDEEEDNEEEEEAPILSWSMIGKSFLVAVIASTTSVFYLRDSSSELKPSFRSQSHIHVEDHLKYGSYSEFMQYSRVDNVDFCWNKTNVYDSKSRCLESKDQSLQLMDFTMKTALLESLYNSYDFELRNADTFDINIKSIGTGDEFLEAETGAYFQQRPKYQRSRALVHVDAPVSSYYHLKNKADGEDFSNAVDPSFTGFAGKFINLSQKPVLLFWDGRERPVLLDTIQPFEAVGTATFPGHQFYVTPEYDKSYVLQRFFITSDTKIMVYDAKPDQSSLSDKEIVKYHAQLLNLDYARDYLVTTKRHWLAMFPRSLPKHFMWNADYFFQEHVVETRETHFIRLPSKKDLAPIYYEGVYGNSHPTQARPLSSYRLSSKAMELNLKVLSCSPRVFEVDNFLSEVEANHILSLATEMTRSTTVGDDSDNQVNDKTRTSSTAWIERHASPILDSIYRRAADLTKIDESLMRYREDRTGSIHESIAESLQLVHYKEGEEYTPHHDFVYPGADSAYQGARFATVLLYLNDDVEGGETVFPRAVNSQVHSGLQVKPAKGKAILFYNMLPDGNMDDLSQHASYPVKTGEKWLANLWLWDPIIEMN